MDYRDLQKIQKESTEQVLPQQKKVLSAADKIRRKTSNLPDPTHPPMGWKDGKGYDQYKTIGSFIGFGPVDAPRFVMLVKIDEPSSVKFAESTAAPVFGEMADFLFQYYRIKPTREIIQKK